MMFGSTEGGKLHTVIMQNVIGAIQMTESFEYCWQCTHVTFDKMCYPEFFRKIGCNFKHPVDTFIAKILLYY